MSVVIVYLQENDRIGVVFPADPNTDMGVLGRRVVPRGRPFKIVFEEDLPDFSNNFDLWTANTSDLDDGVGENDN